MKIYFDIISPEGKKHTKAFAGDSLKIGRDESCHIKLKDSECSSTHAKLFIKDKGLFIEDLNSKNGTSLNGIGVKVSHFQVGDVITVGKTKIQINSTLTSSDTLATLNQGALLSEVPVSSKIQPQIVNTKAGRRTKLLKKTNKLDRDEATQINTAYVLLFLFALVSALVYFFILSK